MKYQTRLKIFIASNVFCILLSTGVAVRLYEQLVPRGHFFPWAFNILAALANIVMLIVNIRALKRKRFQELLDSLLSDDD